MSELRIEDFEIPAASLGPENPLPLLPSLKQAPEHPAADDTIPEQDLKRVSYGMRTGCLPYRVQDHYGRVRASRTMKAIVLENEILRATFFPHLGGRLWSMVHKPSGRELLYPNPVLQLANLALRNAWFSGGVEWNVSVRGHGPFTCSPLFAAQLKDDDGTPILRMYEWERIRGVPFQLDFHLPDGSEYLFVGVRIVNPHPTEIPMYWWSNIAVAEGPRVRTLVPADAAYTLGDGGALTFTPVPLRDGVDISYPTNLGDAAELYFVIPEGRRTWIAAIDETGRGVIQASTARLKGRKLFGWGMNPGGQRWQQFLSIPKSPYFEIQAGLARTQSEYLPMPAESEWTWLEAYGSIECPPEVAHGPDWRKAYNMVDSKLDELLPLEVMEEERERIVAASSRPPGSILFSGSGWGALESIRRQHFGEKPLCSEGMQFERESLTEDQEPWLHLLANGILPYRPPEKAPGAWMVQGEWRGMLEESVRNADGDHWLAWLHLGVMHYDGGDYVKAKAAWQKSLEKGPSAWAYRNLAVLARGEGNQEGAAELWLKAMQMVRDLHPLAVEALRALIDADRPREVLELLESAPEEIRSHGRVQFLRARAALKLGQLDLVGSILSRDLTIPDMREGEISLSDLWFDLKAKQLAAKEGVPVDEALKQRVRREFPPPAHLDFRMAT